MLLAESKEAIDNRSVYCGNVSVLVCWTVELRMCGANVNSRSTMAPAQKKSKLISNRAARSTELLFFAINIPAIQKGTYYWHRSR